MSKSEKNLDDGILYAKIKDAVRLAEKRNFPCFVGFLNERQISISIVFLKNIKFYNYKFFGGYGDCERAVLGVFPDGQDSEDFLFPVSLISFTYNKKFTLTHRDFLGSLMGLGIKRESVGDILTDDGKAFVFVKDEVKDYVISQTEKVGSVSVTVKEENAARLPVKDNFNTASYTVASMRLDNLVSAVTGLSREKSSRMIKASLVYVNSVVNDSVCAPVKEGDKLSIRGKGKFIVSEIGRLTKKGRIKLIIKEYR